MRILSRELANNFAAVSKQNGFDLVVAECFDDARRNLLFGVIQDGIGFGMRFPNLARIAPCVDKGLCALARRAIDRLHDSLWLLFLWRLRDNEVEQMIEAARARQFNLRRVADIAQIQPSNHVLYEESLYKGLAR